MSSIDVNQLVPAVRGVAAAPAGKLPDARVVDELVALRTLADIAEAAYLSRLAVFDTRALSESEQALSTKAWIRHRLHVAPAETARSVKIARTVRNLPVVTAALADGSIRVPHAAAIVEGASLLGAEVIADCQQVLVDAARHDDPTRLRAALRGYGAAVDNPRAIKHAEHRDEGRWLDIATTFDGAVHIQGVLGLEDGAVVKTAINALSTPAGIDDARTAAQRRVDALTELCRRQLASDDLPSRGGEAPHLTVVTDLATIERACGWFRGTARRDHPARGHCPAVGLRRQDHPADRRAGLPAAGCWAGSAHRHRRPAQSSTGPRRRMPLPRVRPTPEWCDVHHVVFWAHGGRTDIDEMILLCRKHHTTVHDDGWRIDMLGRGRVVFTNPAGKVVPSPAHEPMSRLVTRLTQTSSVHEATCSHHHEQVPKPAWLT